MNFPQTAIPLQPAPVLHGPIERIGVFRALMLGDLLCAVPSLRALRAAFPQAEITLVGLRWARSLAQRLGYVDHFVEFPGYPGLPEVPCETAALPDFLAQVQAQRFDLALQLHGSGGVVNPLVGTFGARQTAGFFTPEVWRPEGLNAHYIPWPAQGHEIERLLALTDALELPRQGTHLEFPLRDEDREALAALWPDARSERPYVCVHAGAQLASRRWPLERFAEVADRLVEQGRTVVLTGALPEMELVQALLGRMRHEAVNLVGRTSLWTLGALIEGAERVVSNDTGVSHIAAALGRPSVVISCGADVARWAPLDHELHRVLWAPMACRPCSQVVCPTGHECALAVEVRNVDEALDELLPLPAARLPALAVTTGGACHV